MPQDVKFSVLHIPALNLKYSLRRRGDDWETISTDDPDVADIKIPPDAVRLEALVWPDSEFSDDYKPESERADDDDTPTPPPTTPATLAAQRARRAQGTTGQARKARARKTPTSRKRP